MLLKMDLKKPRVLLLYNTIISKEQFNQKHTKGGQVLKESQEAASWPSVSFAEEAASSPSACLRPRPDLSILPQCNSVM
jgi:hypothetical protein